MSMPLGARVALSFDELRQSPAAMYGGAIGSLKANPAIAAALSPIGQQLLSTAQSAIEGAIGTTAAQLGDAIAGKIVSTIGQGTVDSLGTIVGEVASAVGTAMPLIKIVLDFVISGIGAANADAAARANAQHSVAQRVLSRPLVGSGVDDHGIMGKVTPGDIFGIDPNSNPLRKGRKAEEYGETFFYNYMPASTLGIALASITEDNGPGRGIDPGGSGFITDSNVHHAGAVLDPRAQGGLPFQYRMAWPAESNVGIPAERRTVYQLLRLAIGSRSKAAELTAWPIYLDMLAEDFASGRMTHGYALYLLTTFYGHGEAGNQRLVSSDPAKGELNIQPSIPWSPAEVDPLVYQIESLVNAWRKTRASAKPKMKFHFAKPAFYRVFSYRPEGWDSGQWLTKPNLTRAFAAPASWFAIYDRGGKLVLTESLATVASAAKRLP